MTKHGRFYASLRLNMTHLWSMMLCFLPVLPAQAAEKPKPDAKADAKADSKGTSASGTPAEIEVTPLPRRIVAPKFSFEELTSEKQRAINYKDSRYTLVGVFGTWNRRSAEVVTLINPYIPEFEKRGIQVFGVFSHDTKKALVEWRKVTGVKFTVGLAPLKIIDNLQNPRVPTFWLVNNLGNTLFFSELPKDEEITQLLDKLLLWTNF